MSNYLLGNNERWGRAAGYQPPPQVADSGTTLDMEVNCGGGH